MAKNTLDPKELNPQEIKNILKSRQEYRVALRLQMVYLIHQGKSSREVADIYQVSFKQVLNWVHRFKHQGIEGLKDKVGRGRKASLNKKELDHIRQTILNTAPSEYGYTSKRWTGPLLLKWINKEYKTEFTATTIYKLLEKIGLESQNGKGYVPLD
ncbi:transposase [Gillisia sp. Hel_I_86]|uniref:helix-turn-helix domain-containing protein n=1 Tax=Gillisia sp. Hel_I_86 TaxID=1249981 RepID=UPI00119AF017|nr:helix-turn-helix domain-containing protein [Gillisia sp. Hel_I_86]TVZ25109.1 transposase [Gillisia sp. Hel_I_86]TVZ25869.1 LOW QUALITY PROTEIN: transposase [Gillisia sp. Hel_I_86]TVZ27310.1 transposase [Gillisia sp. Hel_I_86]TVZ28803.1 transposase [Gillisia sp. Hel_I_86]